MRLRRILPLLLGVLVLAAPATAQTTFTVDPVAGVDTPGAGPFLTLGFALTQAAAGDTIELLDGAAYGPSTNGEAYPVLLADQVSVQAAAGASPVFDGESVTLRAFRVLTAITGPTVLSGFTVTNCGTCLEVFQGNEIDGLVLDQLVFTEFAANGLQVVLDTGTGNDIRLSGCTMDTTLGASEGAFVFCLGGSTRVADLTLEDCDIRGTGTGLSLQVNGATLTTLAVRDSAFTNPAGTTGISLDIAQSGLLIIGEVADCTVDGFATGILVAARNGATISTALDVVRNVVLNQTGTGILVRALNPSAGGVSTNSCNVASNTVQTPSGAVARGLALESSGTGGGGSVVNGPVSYNLVANNEVNLAVNTAGEIAGPASGDVTSVFTGNRFLDATGDGVRFTVADPVAARPNASPVLGDATVAGSGRNSIRGSADDQVELAAAMTNVVAAQNCFWDQTTKAAILAGVNVNGAPPPSVSPFLLTTMPATVSPAEVMPSTPTLITVEAGAQAAFVDDPDDSPGAPSQIMAALGATTVAATVAPDGSSLTFDAPSLLPGDYILVVTNPGGETATVTVSVVAGLGTVATVNCAVATAAHGGYDSREVRVLRELRDEYLLAAPAGRRLVAGYYEHGPRLARFIEEHGWMRRAARAALAPPVAVSSLLLEWNRGARLLAGVALLGILFLLLRRR